MGRAGGAVDELAQMAGEYDVMLAITRGALVPAGILAYRLGIRNILVAAEAHYDDRGQPHDPPTFLRLPADPLLHGRRVLIVDEVWDSETTIHAVVERVSEPDRVIVAPRDVHGAVVTDLHRIE